MTRITRTQVLRAARVLHERRRRPSDPPFDDLEAAAKVALYGDVIAVMLAIDYDPRRGDHGPPGGVERRRR